MMRQKRSGVGIVRRAFVHDTGGAVQQRAVDDVAVAGDPADIGRAPVGVFFLEVEDPLGREVRAEHVAAGGVHDPLRLAGRTAGVEDEERMLGVERFGRAIRRGVGHQLVPPVVAAGLHVDLAARCACRRRHFSTVGVSRRASSTFCFSGTISPRAEAAVGGDDHLGLGIVDAVAQRLRH